MTPQQLADEVLSHLQCRYPYIQTPAFLSILFHKLSLEATDPMTGSFSRSTCSGMAALVEAWQQELPAHIIADRFLSKTKPVGLLDAASQFSR